MDDILYRDFQSELDKIKSDGELRSLSCNESHDGKWIIKGNKRYLNLSSNDYLGIAGDLDLHKKFFNSKGINELDNIGLGSSSSRLLAGNHKQYEELEGCLSSLYGREALVFSSGYHANTGILPAIAGKGDVIFSDKLNHASIIDGMRLSGAAYYRYRHLDLNHLEDLLKINRDKYRRAVIVSESLFSMDGDAADIKSLAGLKQRYRSLLYIDEAHAFGVYGEKGLGLCEEAGILNEIDFLIGTFGKALGSVGAFVVCSSILKDYLINKARTFIFTTALPPVSIRWSVFILNMVPSMNEKRNKLSGLAAELKKSIIKIGLKTSGNSQIVPVIIGGSDETVKLAKKLSAGGYMALPVRPPTVPKGTSRLRISLNSGIELSDLKGLVESLAEGI